MRFHGSTARCYLGSRDVSGDLSDVTLSGNADVQETTTFASAGAHESDPGLLHWDATFNAFYDPAVGGIGRQLETLLGATGGILSIYEGLANTLGQRGVLLADGILTKRGQPITVADMIKLTGSLVPAAPSGGARAGLYGTLLHPLGLESTTGNGSAFDGGASSAFGGRANLHVTAATGTGGIVTIEDSADGSTGWATIATFTTTAVPVAQTVEVAGTVRRYTRAVRTLGGASSLTFVVGFARYPF